MVQLNYSIVTVVLLVNYSCVIGKLQVHYQGHRKWLWGSLYYMVLSVLQEVTVGHMAYGKLPITK